MNQLKFYKYATWVLLFLNIAILGFFLLIKPRPPHPSHPHQFQAEVIEILALNEQQVSAFKQLAQEHGQKMTSVNAQQQKLLLPYFKSLTTISNRMNKDSILVEFQQLERKKIEVTYQHFQDIKLMLNKNQLPHFENLMGRFIDRLLLTKEKKSPPTKNVK